MSKVKRLEKNKAAKLVKTEEGKKKDTSPHVHQNKKLDYELNIRVRHELTEKQQKYLDIMLDKKTNVVLLAGSAGVSKTYLSVLAGLMCLNKKTHSDILFLRAPIEVGKSLGYLAGDQKTKESVYMGPLYDKLDEFLSRPEADMLVKNEIVVGTVPNFIRGSSWNGKFVIVDESQNIDAVTLRTIISRVGLHSKIVFCGDFSQSDVRGPIEFARYFDLFNNDEAKELGIHCLAFDRKDIVRSKILGYLLDKIEGCYTPPDKVKVSEPMFDK